MKTLLAFFLVISVLSVSNIQAQDKSVPDSASIPTTTPRPVQELSYESLSKYYFGILGNIFFTGYSTDKVGRDASIKGGVVSDFYFDPGLVGLLKMHSRLIFDQTMTESIFNVDLRFVKDFNLGSFALVYGPTDTRIKHLPHSVSRYAHFLPSGKKVVSPGNRIGVMGQYSILSGGIYANKTDSLEFHISIDKKFSNSLFKRIAVSAYSASYKSSGGELICGGAVTLEVWDIKAMVYGERSELNVETYSNTLSLDVGNNWGLYSTAVYKNKDWQHLEFGFTGTKESLCGPNYLYGAGYQCYPDQRLSIYLQVWLAK